MTTPTPEGKVRLLAAPGGHGRRVLAVVTQVAYDLRATRRDRPGVGPALARAAVRQAAQLAA